ncbi:MAG: hypothetical protein WCB15_08885, partial [Desulfobacterales bacterium]
MISSIPTSKRLKMNRISSYPALLFSLAAAVIVLQFAAPANLNASDDEVVTVTTAWPVDRARPGDS